jgi:hypothetical protein
MTEESRQPSKLSNLGKSITTARHSSTKSTPQSANGRRALQATSTKQKSSIKGSAARTNATFADVLGLLLSGACLVHCLAMPVLLPLLAVNPSLIPEHSLVHILLGVLILPTTAWAARHGYKHHGKRSVAVLLLLGATVITLAAFFGESVGGVLSEYLQGTYSGAISGEVIEAGVTTVGSILLVWGHCGNWKHHTPHTEQCDKNCQH